MSSCNPHDNGQGGHLHLHFTEWEDKYLVPGPKTVSDRVGIWTLSVLFQRQCSPFFFSAMPWGLLYLSFPTRDWTQATAVKEPSDNHLDCQGIPTKTILLITVVFFPSSSTYGKTETQRREGTFLSHTTKEQWSWKEVLPKPLPYHTHHRHYCHHHLNLSQAFPSVSVHCEPVFGGMSHSKDLIPSLDLMGLF